MANEMTMDQIQAPKAEILARFPELAPLFAGNCAGCIKNRIRANLAYKAQQGVDMAGIPADWYKNVPPIPPQVPMNNTTTQAIPGQRPNMQQPGMPPWMQNEPERKACPQCVLKHLGATLVLLDEVELGYPDHLEFAIRHIQQAGPVADKKTQQALTNALNTLKNDKALAMVNKVNQNLEDLLRDKAQPQTVAYWKAIGHMVEAEAECLKHDKALSEAIRMERIALMADPEYKVDVPALLKRLNPSDTTKSAAEKLPQAADPLQTVNPQVTDA